MATTELYSLRWNNFHSNLTHGFHELFQAGEMTDVNLAVEGQIIKAHKIVLSICSPYFREIFKEMPCKHATVILKDLSYQNMMDILTFMYIGEVKISREDLSYFLRMAETLQVKGLTGDDSSETSSRKGDKSDSIGAEEDDADLLQYSNTLIDSDVELPAHSHYSTPRIPTPPPPVVTHQQQPPAAHSNQTTTKRPSKHLYSNSNCKRTKPDHPGSQGGGGSSKSLKNSPEMGEVNSSKPNTNTTCNTTNDDGEFLDASQVKMEKAAAEFDDVRENFKHMLENSFSSGGSIDPANSSDNGRAEAKFKHTHQCLKCDKKFSRRDHLRTHEKNIHGEDAGPFACYICEQMYKNSESLRKHIAKFHFPKIKEEIQKAEDKTEGEMFQVSRQVAVDNLG